MKLSKLNELKQILIDGVGVDLAHAVWEAWVHLERGVLDQLRGEGAEVGQRHNLAGVAVHDQDWDVDLLEDPR